MASIRHHPLGYLPTHARPGAPAVDAPAENKVMQAADGDCDHALEIAP
jgi:hypothetical protein